MSAHLRKIAPRGWRVEEPWDDWAQPSFEAPGRDMKHIRMHTETGNQIDLIIDDKPDWLELFSIDVQHRGEGAGTITMEMLKDYVDSQDKGFLGTWVKNEEFTDNFPWLERRTIMVDGELMLYTLPEVTYGDVPVDAVDYRWMVE